MQLDALLDRLERVQKSGNGYTARCPAHQDRAPSLSVAEGDDRLLLNCHAGCEQDDVLAALGLSWKDIVYDPEPEAIYQYTDEHGNLLYEVLRYPGKRFKQRLANGEWTLGDVRRVLYRLPEVIYGVEQGKTIYICEGEKDVEALRSHGKVATTTAGGAQSWRPEFAEFLRGAKVIICQDKDEPGRERAAAISASLREVAQSVHIVEALEGKDVSDHLEAGYGIEQLVRVDGARRHYKPLDLFAAVPPVAWVVENIVVGGEATLLVADGGAGKSFFALALSLAVAGGEPFLGNFVKPGRVMYVDEEGSPALALQRLHQLGASEAQKRNLDYLNFAGVDLVRHPEKLIEDVQATQPVLVVIDSHAKVARMGEENSNNEMGRVWDDGFLKLARETGAAVLVIHHTSAYGSSRGATQIRNSADQVLTMKKNEDGTQTVYASKPRRLTSSIKFEFRDCGDGRYALERPRMPGVIG